MTEAVSGLENKAAIAPPVHALQPGTWLSCVLPEPTQEPHGGITIDQLAAQHIGQDTPLPSLEVATEEEGGGAACDGTYGCSYGRTISFRTPTTPMPMEFDARKAFEKIFGRGNNDTERRAVSGDYQSLLDMVLKEASSLKGTLGGEDRALVDDYLDSVREIERRLELMGQRDLTKIDLPDVPVARPSFDDLLKLQFDLSEGQVSQRAELWCGRRPRTFEFEIIHDFLSGRVILQEINRDGIACAHVGHQGVLQQRDGCPRRIHHLRLCEFRCRQTEGFDANLQCLGAILRVDEQIVRKVPPLAPVQHDSMVATDVGRNDA